MSTGLRDAGLQEIRRDLIKKADACRVGGTFPSDESRAAFDGYMVQIEAITAAAEGTGTQEQRAIILDLLAQRSDATPIFSHSSDDALMSRGAPGNDRAGMVEALAQRAAGVAASDRARPFQNMRLVDMARQMLEARGESTRQQSDIWIVQRAMHTTSDFAALLTETGDRILRSTYEAADPGVRRIARQTEARDFRPVSRLSLSEHPQLLPVTEHGEVKRGTMGESKESYSLETYGRIFGLTRRAIVNDDLGAFSDFSRRQGMAAVELMAAKLAALLTSNPTLNDGVALFHANHGNLGTPAAISVASLGEALKLPRLQKGIARGTEPGAPLNLTPKYLLVPAALETIARQYVAQLSPASATDVNPFSANLEVVVDPRLDAASATAWYVSTDPTFSGLEYAYLSGAPGPQMESRAGFDVLGIEMRVTLDFGCGVVDHRGLVKNAGA